MRLKTPFRPWALLLLKFTKNPLQEQNVEKYLTLSSASKIPCVLRITNPLLTSSPRNRRLH